MFVKWEEVQKALLPIKDYADLCRKFRVSFSFAFVREAFNFPLPTMIDFTHNLLGGDARQRYNEYENSLVRVFSELNAAGIASILDLVQGTASPESLEQFSTQTRVNPLDTIVVLKYLVYWFIPGEKYLSGLVRSDPATVEPIKLLNAHSIRTNLEMLQAGRTPSGRGSLAEASGLPVEVILSMVNRADFSRLPWASKATISNIIGAGYPSLSALAEADPDQLYKGFFEYGKSIGKNLKLGNEIENSYRIAKIVPRLVQ